MKIETISCVEASDMPDLVLDYCVDHEIVTNYQNDIAIVRDDDNPFANWLRKNGYVFKSDYDYIGVIAT